MLRRAAEVQRDEREDMRGGTGRGWGEHFVLPGELPGIQFVARMTLAPGTSIGVHLHEHDCELYLVLSGHGIGHLDDDQFAVGPGDSWRCLIGHRHGVQADADEELVFMAVLTAPG
jgi:quercetin dioxygenase-like cupin family protein